MDTLTKALTVDDLGNYIDLLMRRYNLPLTALPDLFHIANLATTIFAAKTMAQMVEKAGDLGRSSTPTGDGHPRH